MSDYGEQAETAFRYFAIEGGSDDPGAQHDDGSDWFKPDPTPEPLTAEEEAALRTRRRADPGSSFPELLVDRLLATLAAARDRPGLDVERLARAIKFVGGEDPELPHGWDDFISEVAAEYVRLAAAEEEG